MDALAGLDVCDLHARALVGAADDVAAVKGEADTADRTGHVGQGALTDPVASVPQRDERVRAADGEVLGGGGEVDGVAGGRVSVEDVEDVLALGVKALATPGTQGRGRTMEG